MVKRRRLVEEPEPAVEEGGGAYYDELPEAKEFVPSGSTLLDLILGGGWALGRISNVYGQSSTGKTLIGIEAEANFQRKFPDGKAFYRERESAFSDEYAAAIGLRMDSVDFVGYADGLDTVEDLYDDMSTALGGLEQAQAPGLYCVDSLDAFPDSEELEQAEKDIRKSSSMAKKARVLSQSFRLATGRIAKSRMHVMYISQIRANIGVTMGRKTDMAGGNAIRFYASQRIYLRQTGVIDHEIKGQKRVVGVNIVAKNEKSKVGMPYREIKFPILFSYGIDDLTSCVEFLVETGDAKKLGIDPRKKGDAAAYIKETYALAEKEYHDQMRDVRTATRNVWKHIEELTAERYLPGRKKYL